MNRESARRTRLRKQQQVTSLKEEVSPLCSMFNGVLCEHCHRFLFVVSNCCLNKAKLCNMLELPHIASVIG